MTNLPTASLSIEMFSALTTRDGPHKLGSGYVKSVEYRNYPALTIDDKPEQWLIVNGGELPLVGGALYKLPNGKQYHVFVFEWEERFFSAALETSNWMIQPRMPLLDVWGPFPTVETARQVVELIESEEW